MSTRMQGWGFVACILLLGCDPQRGQYRASGAYVCTVGSITDADQGECATHSQGAGTGEGTKAWPEELGVSARLTIGPDGYHA